MARLAAKLQTCVAPLGAILPHNHVAEEDLHGLDTWKGWKEKDYQMQHCMGMWEEKEAGEDKGRDGWTTSEET